MILDAIPADHVGPIARIPELTQVEEVRDQLTSPLLAGYELDLEALFRM